jgi:hypothetical protein
VWVYREMERDRETLESITSRDPAVMGSVWIERYNNVKMKGGANVFTCILPRKLKPRQSEFKYRLITC